MTIVSAALTSALLVVSIQEPQARTIYSVYIKCPLVTCLESLGGLGAQFVSLSDPLTLVEYFQEPIWPSDFVSKAILMCLIRRCIERFVVRMLRESRWIYQQA